MPGKCKQQVRRRYPPVSPCAHAEKFSRLHLRALEAHAREAQQEVAPADPVGSLQVDEHKRPSQLALSTSSGLHRTKPSLVPPLLLRGRAPPAVPPHGLLGSQKRLQADDEAEVKRGEHLRPDLPPLLALSSIQSLLPPPSPHGSLDEEAGLVVLGEGLELGEAVDEGVEVELQVQAVEGEAPGVEAAALLER
eukprot:768822-Hanusia_phi.AAC.7